MAEDSLSQTNYGDTCNVVWVLPIKYDVVTKVIDEDGEFHTENLSGHKPVCFYVMNDGCIEKQSSIFEKPDLMMKSHLQDNVNINNVSVDGGAIVNLMTHSLLKRIRKFNTDLSPHNMVVSNYEDKIGNSPGAIQVDLVVGTTTRPNLFKVVPFLL